MSYSENYTYADSLSSLSESSKSPGSWKYDPQMNILTLSELNLQNVNVNFPNPAVSSIHSGEYNIEKLDSVTLVLYKINLPLGSHDGTATAGMRVQKAR